MSALGFSGPIWWGCDFDIGKGARFDMILHGSDGSAAVWAAPDLAATADPDTRGLMQFTDLPGPATMSVRGAVGKDLLLSCNKQLDRVAAENPACYQVPGVTIQSAAMSESREDRQSVRLTASEPWPANPSCNLAFAGLHTREDQPIEPETSAIVAATRADDGFVRACLVGPANVKYDPKQQMRNGVFDEREEPAADAAWKLATTDRIFDLADAAGKAENAAVPIHLYVYSDADRTVQFWLGASGPVRLAVDGGGHYASPALRSACTPDEDKTPKIGLRRGWHHIMVTIARSTGPCQLCLRIRSESGAAPEGIYYSAQRPWK
jgi:hypothetical protein